jgi:DtxR family Mn-dependent transcriptional regulator
MLKRLQDSGFVDRSAPDGITLTEQGRLAALQLIRRHRLLEVFLVEIMGFTWDQVDVEAHRLEHSVSAAFEDRMDGLTNNPTRCPHGDLIPSKDGTMPEEKLSPVTALEPGQSGILQRVGNKEPSILRYLSQLKLMPGREVRLVDMAPFNGPVTLELLNLSNGDLRNGDGQASATQILGSELADNLFVQVLK